MFFVTTAHMRLKRTFRQRCVSSEIVSGFSLSRLAFRFVLRATDSPQRTEILVGASCGFSARTKERCGPERN